MSKIYVLGIDSSDSLRSKQGILERCVLVIASKRQAAFLGNISVPIYPVTPLDEACEQIKQGLSRGNVCVLASGDPLFYGIGRTLIKKFGESRVEIHPALSSLQEAFSRFKFSWDDARIVSLHGRSPHHLPGLLLQSPKSFLFTDRTNSPDRIAATLLDYLTLIGDTHLKEEIMVHVAENIGAADEKISSGTLVETARNTYNPTNVMCLLVPETGRPCRFGLTVEEIAHSRGLITKDEVRAVTLHKLRLPHRGIIWDIGGGSGSVSVEMAALNPALTIYTVEHRNEEIAHIKENIRRFNLFNIVPVHGRAKDTMEALPPPDRVFVGGSDGEMESILAQATSRMAEGGRIVVNSVTRKTRTTTPELMSQYGLKAESVTIAVTREETEKTGNMVKKQANPITIITGTQ